MSEAQVTSESPVVASDRRALVLRVLRGTRAPMGIAELAEQIGLHPNTIRFHLDGLDNDGLVERSIESTTAPGRPRVLYQATPEGVRAGPRDYAGLAGVLASALAATAGDPAHAVEDLQLPLPRCRARSPGRRLRPPMGLMQGMLVGAGGVHVASLQPDLESGVCTAQLAR